jgi:alpha-L-arabinofuranosidase
MREAGRRQLRVVCATVLAALACAAPAHGQAGVSVDTAHPGHAVSPELFGQFFEEINYGGVGGLYAEEIRNRAFMDPATPERWVAPSQIARVPGQFGGAVKLNGSSPNRYVELPQGIAAGLHDFTVAAWVNVDTAQQTWARIFDFGNGTSAFMFLTTHAGDTHGLRFDLNAGSASQMIPPIGDPATVLPTGWHHVAVTLAGTTGTLWLDGRPIGTNPNMTIDPADMGVTTQNWIGRSQFAADPLLAATVDDFQIYSRALSAAEIQGLMTAPGAGDVADYHFDEGGGATAVDSSGSGNDATIRLDTGQWQPVEDGGGAATATLDGGTPLNAAITRSLKLQIDDLGAGQRVGMANGGYFGIGVVPGRTYKASLWAKASPGFTGPLSLTLEKADGSQTLAGATVGPLSSEWRRYTATIAVPPGGLPSSDNRFVVAVNGPAPAGASVWLQVVSLFPPTYKDEPNGLRPDLVQKMAAAHPKFLRFPGGNYIEGNYVPGDPWGARFDWKKTIGPIEQRPGHDNNTWGYWSDDGLGLYEYLRLAEDLHATPVIGVFAGLSIGDGGTANVVPRDQLGPYVQDALDEIEYAIGPVTSTWGARRAADGHPAPFPTPYIEVGNEDFLNGGTASYNDYRYPMFYDAIKAAYPQIELIATTPVTSRPMDVIDEHYYDSPAFFASQANRYDDYDRSGPKVFVGEYAVTAGAGNLPTGYLGGSIGEAAFMTGMERNSDVVTMASYAPLFAYVGHTQWNPDLIGFDQLKSYGSTSYYVQRMFASNIGDRVLPVNVNGAAGLYASSTVDSASGQVFTKLVNTAGTDAPVTLRFAGRTDATAKIEVLSDPDASAGNTLTSPDRVVPRTSTLTGAGGVFTYTAPANSLTVVTLPPQANATGTVSGTVPATLSLTLGPAASFGAFTPGVTRDYTASTSADVVSTAGDAALTVSDPDTAHPGHLVNGAFALPSPLLAGGSPLPSVVRTWTAPVSHDPVDVEFLQHIDAHDPLRTGSYAKTLTFTLSTTSP